MDYQGFIFLGYSARVPDIEGTKSILVGDDIDEPSFNQDEDIDPGSMSYVVICIVNAANEEKAAQIVCLDWAELTNLQIELEFITSDRRTISKSFRDSLDNLDPNGCVFRTPYLSYRKGNSTGCGEARSLAPIGGNEKEVAVLEVMASNSCPAPNSQFEHWLWWLLRNDIGVKTVRGVCTLHRLRDRLFREIELSQVHRRNVSGSAMKTPVRWSVEDYHCMIEAGILGDRRVELLVGEIIEMSPETPIHYNTVKRGARYLQELLAGRADVRFNGPITLSNSEPEPDIAIVRLPESTYDQRHPEPQDIFWIIEAAKTSLEKNLGFKASIYATAEIQEYWVLDLPAKRMVLFRDPQNGQYVTEQTIEEGTITPSAFPDTQVSVERLLA